MSPATFPAGACDTHLHFYDRSFPVAPDAVLRPPDATVDDYRPVQRALGLERIVVVQPTTYGLDNRCQLAAMAAFGGSARGVMVVDASTSEAELERLTTLGVRGARFHMLPGGAVGWEHLEPVAERIAGLGWHIQLQLNGRELTERLARLMALTTPLVVDHVGRFMPPVPPSAPAFAALLTLIEAGRTWVKLSAPYESSTAGGPDYTDVAPLITELTTRAPERLLWASNWPHPGQADPPDTHQLGTLAERWLPEESLRQRVLVDNPAIVYDF